MEKIKLIIKKLFSREIIMYGIFGVLATIVNFATFSILISLKLNENLSNIIAIIIAVLFAYFTNSKFVFQSKITNKKDKLKEFYKFILGRAFTMVVEIIGFFVLFNLIGLQEFISKISIAFIIIILNFFISKFFTFKNSNQ